MRSSRRSETRWSSSAEESKATSRKPLDRLDCAIIGGGPGGLTAAIYLARFRRKVAVFESGIPRAAWIPKTWNLPGYVQGISGQDLLRRMRSQVQRLGVDRICALARVELRAHGGFRIHWPGSPRGVLARTVILATGIEDIQPSVERLNELRGLGLLRYCAICDGYEFKDEPLLVLAQDDGGLARALFLRQWSSEIRIIVPPTLKIAPTRMMQIRRCRGVRVTPCHLLELEPTRRAKAVRARLDHAREVEGRVVYVELGARVRDEAFAHLRELHRSRDGHVITSTEQRTSIPGIFAVGDCVYQIGQISVAAGHAAIAATTIHNDLC